MKRSILNVPDIFALKSLFFEKNEIQSNHTDRHTMESFSQFKSSPIKLNQTIHCLGPINWRFWDSHDVKFMPGR